jgi:excisionase family DNA binding protein
MATERRWLTAAETGEYLHLHPKSVYRACLARKLPHAKIPGVGVRIDKRELDVMLERESVTPGEYGKRLKD